MTETASELDVICRRIVFDIQIELSCTAFETAVMITMCHVRSVLTSEALTLIILTVTESQAHQITSSKYI